MNAHFQSLLRLLEMEHGEERRRYRAMLADLSLKQRAARGLALTDVDIVDERSGLGGRLLLDCERTGSDEVGEAFRPGAVVEVHPRDDDAEPQRAIVSRRRGRSLQIAFDRPPPTALLHGKPVIELAPDDLTFARHRRAVESFARRPASDRQQRLVLGEGEPRFRDGPVAGVLPDATVLNPEQRLAVERALCAEDIFLIHGPPGTGKSSVLGAIVHETIRAGDRVLVTAASNAAVDHLLGICLLLDLNGVRVGHPARVDRRLIGRTLDVLVEEHPERRLARELFDEAFEQLGYARRQRKRGRSRDRFANARAAGREARGLFEQAREHERRAVRSVLSSANVIGATTTALSGAPLDQLTFDLVVLDEATQATLPASLLALSKAPRVVLAGDHRQLPPTVLSREAQRGGLGVSLFERWMDRYGETASTRLTRQYRMNRTIMAFPSEQFYDGALRADTSVVDHTLEGLDVVGVEAPPLLFVDTAGRGWHETQPPDSESYCNEGEAELALSHARALLDGGLTPDQIGIIAPYSAQVRRLQTGDLPHEVEIASVDAFQGREKEAIIFSTTRSNETGDIGFLQDLRRMNVAMTRARRHLFIVGDSATLGAHPFYAQLVDSAQRVGAYRSVWEWPGAGEI